LALLPGHIKAEDSAAALKWYRGFKEVILSLEKQPSRCPVTPESDKFRHLLYGNNPHTYRAIFRVLESRSTLKCCTSATAQGGDSRMPMSHKRVLRPQARGRAYDSALSYRPWKISLRPGKPRKSLPLWVTRGAS
jgi:hypothetical protein